MISPTAPVIDVHSLAKRFGELEVLSGISLSVYKGEVAVVVGPSGGGKSTFLRCLNGLETFDAGHVDVAGIDLRPDLPNKELQALLLQVRRRVGMVFQQFNLFPHRSVLENVIEAPMYVLGKSRAEADVDARRLLDRVGLSSKIDQMPDRLSGGQQQRVAIARALAMQPDVMLFDEPTSALDPRMASEVESVIADLAASGQTMVVVTHSMNLARRTAHSMYVFEGGKVLESGPPEQIFESPRLEATRLFVSQVKGA
jgi:ABC-type polar amino acid transport system ATPase subunit